MIGQTEIDRKSVEWSDYGFVVTTLWIGFVLAISAMETPLRFHAPSITLPVALEIGHHVFHALNYVEIAFTLLLLIILLHGGRQRRSVMAMIGLAILVAFQTWMLFAVLDVRTLAIINGADVPESPFHTVYVVAEGIKLIVLILLTLWLLREFRLKIVSATLEMR